MSIRKFKSLMAGIVVLAVAAAVLAWPVMARCEAVTIEQEKERIKAVTDIPDPAGPPDRISVFVHVQPGASRGPIKTFAAGAGGIVKYEYKTVLPNVMNLRNIPVTAKEALERIPGVVRIVEDKYHENLIKLDESTPLISGLQSQISGAGYSADGAGVRVCVCDTGIDTDHIMYRDRIDFAASYDFYYGDNNPEDDHGHGSHVAGIAVGGTGLTVDFGCEDPEPFQGVAPKATLIGVKILNLFGGGFDSDIIAGINHCADPGLPGGPADVINLSIGTGEYSGPCDHEWAVASNNAVAAGVVVVAASGNENYANALSSPACGSNVIAVGATYKNNYPNCEDSTSAFNWSICSDFSPSVDDIACFSNESDYLDVTAPGAVIWSASTADGGSSITGMSGTSMAAPHVAGLAALILSADPTLTPDEVRQIIRDGAIDMGTPGFDRTYGYGRIDVTDSLALISPCIENTDCDDGLFCNGGETCSLGDCLPGQDPCPGETCDEYGDACVPLVCDEDGTCEQGENCNNCPSDCISGGGEGGVCGNGVCEPGTGEDCSSCPSDCAGKQVGTTKRQFCCGDGDGTIPVDCSDPRCTSEGFECGDAPLPYCCGDLLCEGDEDSTNCEIDCGPAPFCGDDNCDPGEDLCNEIGSYICADCGTPESTETSCSDGVDNDCDGAADCDDSICASDPACNCGAKKSPCTEDSECCSNWCHRGACK